MRSADIKLILGAIFSKKGRAKGLDSIVILTSGYCTAKEYTTGEIDEDGIGTHIAFMNGYKDGTFKPLDNVRVNNINIDMNEIKGIVVLKKGEGRNLKQGGLWIYDNETFDDSAPDREDDIYIGRIRNKETRKLRNYHYISSSKPYDSVPKGCREIDHFHVRMVKIQLPSGKNEYLLTDLPKSQFSLSDLNEIYRLRWGIEVSYRYLKYASGMIHVHSLKQDFIFQEILAKLTCYNFCAAVLKIINAPTKKKQKYKYTLEKTYVIKCCMRYLKNEVENLLFTGKTFDECEMGTCRPKVFQIQRRMVERYST